MCGGIGGGEGGGGEGGAVGGGGAEGGALQFSTARKLKALGLLPALPLSFDIQRPVARFHVPCVALASTAIE